MAYLKWYKVLLYSGLSFPPQLVPVTRITLCQPGVERQKWRKTGIVYTSFFPGVHWTLFYLVLKYYHNERPNEEHGQKGQKKTTSSRVNGSRNRSLGYIKESGQETETGLGRGGPRGAVHTEEARDQGETIVGMRDYRHGENTEQRYRYCFLGHRPDPPGIPATLCG